MGRAMKTTWIVILGDQVRTCEVYGPFASIREADDFGFSLVSKRKTLTPWYVSPVQKPDVT